MWKEQKFEGAVYKQKILSIKKLKTVVFEKIRGATKTG
jgi:hypothetical protein